MKVAIVGAGFAGIATARVLVRLQHDVTVFEAMPDVGGVWSKTRHYPGLRTQSCRTTYHLSEMDWPEGTPSCPPGYQVQAYLESFVKQFGLLHHIRLSTEVLSAVQDPAKRWILTYRRVSTDELDSSTVEQETFDHLVVCNGTFSSPFVPHYPGREVFEAAGGHVVHSSKFSDTELARNKNVVVVGYGKSACDLAVTVSRVSRSTTVVARKLRWKLPPYILGIIPTDQLVMPRISESLFVFKRSPTLLSRLLNGHLSIVRQSIFNSLQYFVARRNDLESLDLVPTGRMDLAVSAELAIVSEGFFDGVRDSRIQVVRDTCIQSLGQTSDGSACVTLEGGTTVKADLVLAASGWKQGVPFLDPALLSQFTTPNGDFVLYRWCQPPNMQGLWFNGYVGSLNTATSIEITALWIGAAISGHLDLPSPDQRLREAQDWLGYMESCGFKHAHGTQHVPFTFGVIDTLLGDLGVQVEPLAYVAQWFTPLSPAAYKTVGDRVVADVLAQSSGNIESKI
ncbi:flavin-containing monooxygenase [Auriculariales sp. MPI-PUGE-AT-0066]|nr:flavin-containing monooxygenase [Auriculariales sp. MPI-PUGE-AT-0066]